MNSSPETLQKDLARLAITLIGFTLILAAASGVLLGGTVRRDVLASLAVVLGAVLVGFVPLRILLRTGPQNIVAAWIASMILRMFGCLAGLVVLLKKYELSQVNCVIVVCGGYLVMLAIETIGLNRLIRNAFARQAAEKSSPVKN